MDKQRLIEIARGAMAGVKAHPARETGYVFHHGLRVAKIAMDLLGRLGEPAGAAPGVIWAACLFHDVGKGVEPHHQTGAARARELLAGELPATELRTVAELILLHNQRGREGLSTAAKVVQDADLLDHFGAQCVWLCISWSRTYDRTIEQALEFYNGAENGRYIAGSRASLHFAASREEFDRRVAVERRFFDELAAESFLAPP
jgi:uncharacterized protein